MALHNRVNREELIRRLHEEPFHRTTISFYRYVIIDQPGELRNELFRQWDRLGVFGRVYVAREGINAQVSVPEHNFDAFRHAVDSMEYFKDVPFKIAVEDDGKSFYKLTIKVRPKLVNDGLNEDTFDVTNVGKHLNAEEFNEAVRDENTVVVDMRNYYEYEVGHFEGALNPDGVTFRKVLPEMVDRLKDQKDKKVLLYCTGGIRCEKASAYFKHHGFKDVNQLHGGIIDYAQQIKVKQLDNKFLGKNFVFDHRLGEKISDEVISHCYQCGQPCDTHVNCKNDECHLLFIQCDECAEKYDGCCSEECKDYLNLPQEMKAEKTEVLRKIKGQTKYFNKDKSILRQKFKYFDA